MPTTLPDVSIVIVNWNTRDLLLACLASLPEAVNGLHAEIWVVDNNSTDDSVAALRDTYPHVHLIVNEENLGFATANNQAIRSSQGRHVLLLNSDTVALPGSITTLVRFLDQHPHIGIAGAQLLNGDGSLQLSWASFPTIWSELRGKNVRVRRPYVTQDGSPAYAVDWVGGACLLIRRAAVDQIGLLDEAFFMYSEEADWCFRVKQQGWRVCYYPAAQVIHFGGQSSKKASTRMKCQLYQSKLLFFTKHYGPRRAQLLSILLQLLFLSKAGVGWVQSLGRKNTTSTDHPPYHDAVILAKAVGYSLDRARVQLNTK